MSAVRDRCSEENNPLPRSLGRKGAEQLLEFTVEKALGPPLHWKALSAFLSDPSVFSRVEEPITCRGCLDHWEWFPHPDGLWAGEGGEGEAETLPDPAFQRIKCDSQVAV